MFFCISEFHNCYWLIRMLEDDTCIVHFREHFVLLRMALQTNNKQLWTILVILFLFGVEDHKPQKHNKIMRKICRYDLKTESAVRFHSVLSFQLKIFAAQITFQLLFNLSTVCMWQIKIYILFENFIKACYFHSWTFFSYFLFSYLKFDMLTNNSRREDRKY